MATGLLMHIVILWFSTAESHGQQHETGQPYVNIQVNPDTDTDTDW